MSRNIAKKQGVWNDDKILSLLLDEFPYVLDQKTWNTFGSPKQTNEALVDNWRVLGIVLWDGFVDRFLSPGDMSGIRDEVQEVAEVFDVPVFNSKKEKIWEP